MKFDSQKHHRRSIRLKEYDYTQPGGYFITIVTYRRDLLFGEIVNEQMQLSDYGRIADECWRAIPDHFSNVELGAYTIMPKHVRGIFVIRSDASASERRGTIIVSLPKNLGNLLLDQFRQLFERSNPPSPAELGVNSTPQVFGSATILNT